ncbi:hypothetical protein J2129_002404 [Methanofollis sp. W23]|uniref:hypothetical protein n=1 Tax=Methanofollis sp. W23 TaxID=2817849 RepID=UPI001AE41E7E|nr:hypothetical protein [Methanofollis sp. W23]MBP2146950.1 hypothetical protein [Methanofollis sp. W23]
MSLRDDDSALLSIDFLAGFTVFLLAFIVAASMVPGMLASLQSSTVDHDAVAYRTGVILAEDPGWWFDEVTMTGHTHWEGERTALDSIKRMGLAISKDTPGILSMGKVDRFFNQTEYNANPEFYSSNLFFSDYPYAFNISLKEVESGDTYTIGSPVPKDTTDYGSIRRMVMLKEVGPVVLNSSTLNSSGITGAKTFAIRLDFSEIMNQSLAYRVDPYEDRIEVRLEDLDHYSGSEDVMLEDLDLYRGPSKIPTNRLKDTRYSILKVGDEIKNPDTKPSIIANNISLILEPGFFTYDIVKPSQTVDIKFTFNKTADASWTYLNGTYDYASTPSPLKPAVLEVAIW